MSQDARATQGGREWRQIQNPDKWLTMRTISAGGGHGPILLGKLEAGGGGQLHRPRELLIPT
jgi:hypothetical protein